MSGLTRQCDSYNVRDPREEKKQKLSITRVTRRLVFLYLFFLFLFNDGLGQRNGCIIHRAGIAAKLSGNYPSFPELGIYPIYI